MKKRKQISSDEARCIGDSLYLDWDQVDLEQFRQGLMGNRIQRAMDPETRQIYDGVLLTGKVVLAHTQEIPDYFNRLARLKAEISKHRFKRRKQIGA
jgi:hypothetical protein